MIDLAPIARYVDAHLDQHVALLQEYVRQPSVSVEGTGMRECAELVARHYRWLGCREVEIVETETYPGVWAYFDAGAPRTIVNYSMYDVRSVGDQSGWSHPPFAAALERHAGFPLVMFGRGACVPKGPDMAWLCALKSIIETRGSLPVNIAFLAEGDEILGSPSYRGLIDRYRDRLRGIEGCLYLRATQDRLGELPLVLGYKGLLSFELVASGARWGRGPARAPAHSATKSIVDSPVWRLVQALASLVEDGQPAVGGWRELFSAPALSAEDEELVQALCRHFEGRPWERAIPGLAEAGVARFAGDLAGPALLRQYVGGSTLNIQGIHAGYTGPGTRTFTIPHEATALIDARLQTERSPEELLGMVRAHLDAAGFPDIDVRLVAGYPASRTPLSAPLVQSFLRAARRAGASPVIWPRQGYGGPWSIFANEFGAPVVFATGIGHGGGVGLTDEFLVLDGGGMVAGLREMELFAADLLFDFAAS